MTMVPLDLDLRSTKGAQKKTRTFLGFGDMLIACHNVTWCQSGSLKENPRAAGHPAAFTRRDHAQSASAVPF